MATIFPDTKFMKWFFPSLNLDMSIVVNKEVKYQNKMANSVDPDNIAHYEPYHLDL